MLTAFDHVVIAVRDLASATERTAALFGRPPSWRGVHPGAGTANSLFRLENGYVELLAAKGEGPIGAVVEAALAQRGEGMLALAFATADLAATLATLRQRGIAVALPQAGEGRGVPADAAEAGATAAEATRRWSSVLLPTEATRGLPLLVLQHLSPPESLPMTDPSAKADAAVVGLDHAVVVSDDPGASAAVYGDGLGLRLALDRAFPERGVRIFFFRIAGVTVEVAGPLESRADSSGLDRFGGLAYRVPDADAIRARLLNNGFDVSEVRPGHKSGTRVCTVRNDPFGVPTLLIEPAPRGRLPGDGGGG